MAIKFRWNQPTNGLYTFVRRPLRDIAPLACPFHIAPGSSWRSLNSYSRGRNLPVRIPHVATSARTNAQPPTSRSIRHVLPTYYP